MKLLEVEEKGEIRERKGGKDRNGGTGRKGKGHPQFCKHYKQIADTAGYARVAAVMGQG